MTLQYKPRIKKCRLTTFTTSKPAIKIHFPFDSVTVERVKSLDLSRYHKTKNDMYWTTPLTLDNVDKLDNWGFQFSMDLKKWYGEKVMKRMKMKDLPAIKVLGMDYLRLYQLQGVSFIEQTEGNCIIADDQGLGKTEIALAYIKIHPELKNIIILCPASVKLQWIQRIQQRLGYDYNLFQIKSFPTKNTDVMDFYETNEIGNSYGPKRQTIFVCNYKIYTNKFNKNKKMYRGKEIETKTEILNTGWADLLDACNPDLVIADECHYFSNPTSNVSITIQRCLQNVGKFIGLSGTPIETKALDIFVTANIIDPSLFPSFWSFKMRYCDPKNNGYGMTFKGATNVEELHKKLSYIMIRRLKIDVLTELPVKTRTVVPLSIDNRREYQKALGLKHTNKVETLKQLALQGKMKGVITWIDDILYNGSKLVVYVWHNSTVEMLMKKYKKIAVQIYGKTSAKDREKAKNKFINNCETKLLIGNIQSAGTGIDGLQTVCDTCCFVEFPWKPKQIDQAEDRLLRMGLKSDKMMSYFLLGVGTIEDDIMELLDAKRKIVDSLLEGKETEDFDLLTELRKRYK